MNPKGSHFGVATRLAIACLAGVGLFAVLLPCPPALSAPPVASTPGSASQAAIADAGGTTTMDGQGLTDAETPTGRRAGTGAGAGASSAGGSGPVATNPPRATVIPGANGPTGTPRVFARSSDKPVLQPFRPPAWEPGDSISPILPTPTPGATPTPTSRPTAGITPTPPPTATPPAGGYYVATTGSDSAAGSASAPWRTLQHAADAAPSGATIYAHAGTYGPFAIKRSGLTFTQYPGETAVIKGSSNADNVVEINGVSSATLTYLTVTGNVVQYGSGIAVDSSSGVKLSHLSIHDNTSFGIRTTHSSVTIEQSDIFLNHSGVEIAYEGTVSVTNNDIHDNNKMVDPGVGGQGVSFYMTTGSVVAANNRIWANRTLPGDPEGPDGTGFEVYGAKNVTMTANVLYDNMDTLETGTDAARTACTNVTFTKNLSYKSSGTAEGIIIRCADHSLFAANTLVGLDKFAFDISSNYEEFGGSIEGLRIVDNLVANGRTYSIDNAIPASVVMDYNLAYTTSSSKAEFGTYDAWIASHDQTTSLAQFQSWTGQAAHDVWGRSPLLDTNDCPTSGSPAIDAGLNVGLSFKGAAPDIGYCEIG